MRHKTGAITTITTLALLEIGAAGVASAENATVWYSRAFYSDGTYEPCFAGITAAKVITSPSLVGDAWHQPLCWMNDAREACMIAICDAPYSECVPSAKGDPAVYPQCDGLDAPTGAPSSSDIASCEFTVGGSQFTVPCGFIANTTAFPGVGSNAVVDVTSCFASRSGAGMFRDITFAQALTDRDAQRICVTEWTDIWNTPQGQNVVVQFEEGVAVTFDNVLQAGSTNFEVSDTGPTPPANFEVCGLYYEISTTAVWDQAEVCLPTCGGTANLYHYENGAWFNVTSSNDGSTICGIVDSVSPFAVFAAPVEWSGVLQPINADGSSIFKLGRTVPVKFQFTGSAAGTAYAQVEIYLAKVTDDVVGDEVEADSTAQADSGNTFRYDASKDQYVYNLSTDDLSTGTWRLRLDFGDGVTRTVLISLR